MCTNVDFGIAFKKRLIFLSFIWLKKVICAFIVFLFN